MTSSHTSSLNWAHQGQTRSCVWQSANLTAAPSASKILIATPESSADKIYQAMCEGFYFIWQGDFHLAKQLFNAIKRRLEKRKKWMPPADKSASLDLLSPQAMKTVFHQHRQQQIQQAKLLGMLLIEVQPSFTLAYSRAPQIQEALQAAIPDLSDAHFVMSLRECLGYIGAYEWRKKGVFIEALGQTIHPYYGVFSPIRGEYITLLNKAPLPRACQEQTHWQAWDIGVGSGIITALLAQRGAPEIIATDCDSQALQCAQDNLHRLSQALNWQSHIQYLQCDLFPPAPKTQPLLMVCNPPWLPVKANARIEHAIYDPDSRMLKGFLQGVSKHLHPDGEAWLIMSNLAELLGLRTEHEWWDTIQQARLQVVGKLDIKPHHPKALGTSAALDGFNGLSASDQLALARQAEVTSLWRLRLA